MQQAGNGEVTQGDSFASLLLGWGTSGQLRIKPPVADKSKETGFYIQDDWKVNSKLTLNIGLRYEWSTPYTERYNRSTFADFTDSTGVTVPGLGESERHHAVSRRPAAARSRSTGTILRRGWDWPIAGTRRP